MLHDTPFLRSLHIQLRVIGALLMRELITRYGRNNIGILWLMIEPMLFTLGITTLWSFTRFIHNSNVPIVAFAVTGYSSILIWRNCANRCALAIQPNQSLLYHRNVRVIDLLLTRIILEIAGAFMSLIVIITAFTALEWMKPPEDIGLMLFGTIMLSLFGMAIGLFIGAWSERHESVERLWHTFTYLFFPLSGAAYMVDWLPAKLQPYALYLPMVNGVEMMRGGYFGASVRVHYNLPYMFFSTMLLMLVALILVRDAGQRVEPG